VPDRSFPKVVLLSLWRDDAERCIQARMEHLLSKATRYMNLRLCWLVGDSSDNTEELLRRMAMETWVPVEVIRHDTGIPGTDERSRRRRLAETCNAGLDAVRADDDFVIIHESDLASPVDVVGQLVAHGLAGRCPVAGWPVLPVTNPPLFYDVWAYRRDGKLFTNLPPYHDCYRADEPFEVDSVGSCWMMHAADVRNGARMDGMACVGLCDVLRSMGRRIWVDPSLIIAQEPTLWEPHSTED
jgi:hypothetical protein